MTIYNKEYYYGQTSAPPMAGTIGYMISILDAFLVTRIQFPKCIKYRCIE